MLVRTKSVSITTRLRAQLRTIYKFKSAQEDSMHTLRAVVSHGASDGIVDNHHAQAVVAVVADRTHLAGPLPQIILVPAAGAQYRARGALRAVVAHGTLVGHGCCFSLRAVVASCAVAGRSREVVAAAELSSCAGQAVRHLQGESG